MTTTIITATTADNDSIGVIIKMNLEGAIKQLEKTHSGDTGSMLDEAIDIALESLKRQIPVKVEEWVSSNGTIEVYCGICDELFTGDWNFCPNCGQATDLKGD